MADMQPVTPGYPLAVRRELLNVQGIRDEDGQLFIRLTCDCATIADVAIVGDASGEIAVSCPGCHTPHWITLGGGAS